MKTSKIALLSLGGVVLAAIVAVAVAARVALGWNDLGGRAGAVEAPGEEPGEMTTASHDLSGFDRVEINGNWSVEVVRGDGWRVELSYPENYLSAIDVSVRGERLRLDGARPGSFFGGSGARYAAEIVMPALLELDVSGSNRVRLSGFEGERLTIDVAGATQVTGEDGRYAELDLSMAGANDVELEGFVFTDAHVDLAGASDLTLTMDGGELTGSLAGVGSIEYSGTVSREAVDVAGFGSVGPAER